MLLSLLDLLKMVEGYTRPIREGEAYYESGLLYAVGLLERNGTVYKCQGLAVQTSAVSSKPHEIDVTFDSNKEEGNRILSLKCSCIAGLSVKCKHAIATLLWLIRKSEDELPEISCTDLERQWGKLKTSGKPDLEACTLTNMCHPKEATDTYDEEMPEITEAMKKKWIDRLMKCKLSH